MQNPEQFRKLLSSDLNEYMETGNIHNCSLLAYLLAVMDLNGNLKAETKVKLITSEESCLAMLKIARQIKAKEIDVYLDKGMVAQAIICEDLCGVLDNYILLFKNG